MSFGYGIGDVPAILGLLERVVIEIRFFRQAPSHFQQLQVELELLRTTLSRVLDLQAEDVAEYECINRVRAITIHCQHGLETFLAKMQSKEPSLGHFRTAWTLSAVGTRLHWSMVTRKDVQELREIVVSQNTSILILLGSLQIIKLRNISTENRELKQSFSQDMPGILRTVQAMPRALAALHDFTRTTSENQHQDLRNIAKKIDAVRAKGEITDLGVARTADGVEKSANRVLQAVDSLYSVMMTVRKLIKILLQCSQDILDTVSKNARLLLEIHSQVGNIARLMHLIPLQMIPPFIQLDDALGGSWALPLQACTDWQGFNDLLRSVVYPPGMPGHISMMFERFVISHAGSGRTISEESWKNAVRNRLHIQQAVLISKPEMRRNHCPYSGCMGKLIAESRANPTLVCSKCERQSTLEVKDKTLLSPFAEPVPEPYGKMNRPIPRRSELISPQSSPIKPLPGESAYHFRRIHVFQYRNPIESLNEAQEILKCNPSDARANQFMGWYSINSKDKGEIAIEFLKRAVEEDPTGGEGQSWYLLGRAYEKCAEPLSDWRRKDKFQKDALARPMVPEPLHRAGVVTDTAAQYTILLRG
ncbi:hypothetical protein EV356DRAFT_533738 [Viridothelium virens]|uniref:Ubiquitin-like domain-containing protein n=1 Tax=Viridothelium virens TaxID=1048519 RepID=A0A6A6H746_VIRVR|nr:hypothetical protein EV356DRAFT_533738 [Viridothelium virens]